MPYSIILRFIYLNIPFHHLTKPQNNKQKTHEQLNLPDYYSIFYLILQLFYCFYINFLPIIAKNIFMCYYIPIN